MKEREKKRYEAPVVTRVKLDEEGFISLGACNKENDNGCWVDGVPGGTAANVFDPS